MTVDDEKVRVAIYRSFATTGAAPDDTTLAAGFGTDINDVRERLQRLAEARHVVLDDGRIVMAHPFSGYTGRLDPGYKRQEPADAARYFLEVGLNGSFWGL